MAEQPKSEGREVELAVEPGDQISQGDVWALIHHNREIYPGLSLVKLLHYCPLIGRELHNDATPALFCHKEPARSK